MADRPERSLEVGISGILKEFDVHSMEALQDALSSYTRRVKQTYKRIAPRGPRFIRRDFDAGRPHIADDLRVKREKSRYGSTVSDTFILHFGAPNNRIAHLAEWGFHARNHRFVDGSHALDTALKQEREPLLKELGDLLTQGSRTAFGLR